MCVCARVPGKTRIKHTLERSLIWWNNPCLVGGFGKIKCSNRDNKIWMEFSWNPVVTWAKLISVCLSIIHSSSRLFISDWFAKETFINFGSIDSSSIYIDLFRLIPEEFFKPYERYSRNLSLEKFICKQSYPYIYL